MMKYVSFFAIALLLTACQSQDTAKTPVNITKNQTVKVITPDWVVASTLTAMGYPPLATGDTKTYQKWVAEPKLPNETIDLGARFAPNPERLAQLKADVIIDNDFYAHLRPLYGNTPHTAHRTPPLVSPQKAKLQLGRTMLNRLKNWAKSSINLQKPNNFSPNLSKN